MKRALAATIDTLAVLVLGYAGFRLALIVVPCKDLGECLILTPLAVIAMVGLAAAYFLAGHLVWHRTPGERIVH